MIEQILTNGLIAGLLLGLVAIGFSIVYSAARFFHVAHAAMYLAGAYTGIWLSNNTKTPGFVAVLGAIVAAVTLGLLIELSVYRPLRKVGASSLVLFLSSLTVLLIVQNAIGLIVGSEIQTVQSRIGQDTLQILGSTITSWQAISSGVTVLLFLIIWLLLRFTLTGKKMRAVSSDPDLAEVVGISRDNVLLIVIVLGSSLAGIAGFLVGYDTAVTPSSGLGVLLIAVTAAIVGGIGSIPGAMFGGLLVGVAQHIGVWRLPAQWQDAIVFGILILFLILRPQGFFGRPIWRTAV